MATQANAGDGLVGHIVGNIAASGRNPLTFLIIRQILLNETKNVLLVKKNQMFTVHKQVAQSRKEVEKGKTKVFKSVKEARKQLGD